MRPNPDMPMTRAEALDRVVRLTRDVVAGKQSCYYDLGRGGTTPRADVPWDEKHRLDCTGWLAYGLGYDRYNPLAKGRYLNSTEIVRQGMTEGAKLCDWFDLIPSSRPVLPMDVIVFGWFDRDGDGDDDPGHGGIITSVSPTFVRHEPRWWEGLEVSDCSPSNSGKNGKGRALAFKNAAIWRKRGVILRYNRFLGE